MHIDIQRYHADVLKIRLCRSAVVSANTIYSCMYICMYIFSYSCKYVHLYLFMRVYIYIKVCRRRFENTRGYAACVLPHVCVCCTVRTLLVCDARTHTRVCCTVHKLWVCATHTRAHTYTLTCVCVCLSVFLCGLTECWH